MLKYIDFAIQTLCIIIPFATDFLGLHTAVFMALLIGPVQLVSSSLSVLNETPLLKYKSIHLLLCVAFFIFFFAGAALGIIVRDSVYQLTFPLMLGAYYYIITAMWVFHKIPRNRHSVRHTHSVS